MGNKCNKYLEPTGVVLGKSTRVLGKVTLTTEGVYDSTKEYDRISLVYDPNSYISYISKQNVPAGTALNNTDYWQPLNSAILGPGQTLNGILNMLNTLNLPNESSFLHYNEDNHTLEWVDVEELLEIINNYYTNNPDGPSSPFSLNEPLKSINSIRTSASQAGQMLIYNGSQWRLDKISNIPQALGEPLKSISNLGTPSGSNKVIVYKNGSWSYQDASSSNYPTPSSAGYLYYNGSSYSWKNITSGDSTNLNDLLSALNTTSMPSINEQKYLYWNGLSFSWSNGTGYNEWTNAYNSLLTRITNLENTSSLKEPLTSINTLNSNPSSTGMILVYREGGWQFEAKSSGSGPGTSEYNDDWIYEWKSRLENETIAGINSTITNLQNQLNGKLTAVRADIENWIDDALANYQRWLDQGVVDEIFGYSNFGTKATEYLQEVGLLDSNGTLTNSRIQQQIDSIRADVNLLTPDGNGNFTALQTQLQEYITRVNGVDTAIGELKTRFAIFDDQQNLIGWKASGFETQTNQYMSFADMYAATENAISQVKTSVTNTQNSLGNLTTAHSSLAAQINGDNATGTGGLVAEVNAIKGELVGVDTTVLSAIDDQLAAFRASATFDEAVATMLASTGSDTYAAIQAIAENDNSFIGFIADRLHFDSDLATFRGDVVASSFQTGSSGEYGITALSSIPNNYSETTFFNNAVNGGNYALWNKVYFYNDGDSMNLAIYRNNAWSKLDLTNIMLYINNTQIQSWTALNVKAINDINFDGPVKEVFTAAEMYPILVNTQLSGYGYAANVTYYRYSAEIVSGVYNVAQQPYDGLYYNTTDTDINGIPINYNDPVADDDGPWWIILRSRIYERSGTITEVYSDFAIIINGEYYPVGTLAIRKNGGNYMFYNNESDIMNYFSYDNSNNVNESGNLDLGRIQDALVKIGYYGNN